MSAWPPAFYARLEGHCDVTRVLPVVRRLETLCVSENTIQVDPLPPGQCLLQVNFVPREWAKILLRRCLWVCFAGLASKPPASNSVQKHLKTRRCPRTFWPGFYLPELRGAIFPRTVYPGMSLSLLPKQRIFTSLGVWFGKLLLRYFDKRVIR